MVVDLDITSPIRRVSDIQDAIEKKRMRKDTDVVFSVVPSRRNPYFNMVREEGAFYVKAIASDFTSRQQTPELFDMNASIYAYSPEALMTKETKTFFNTNADVVLMKDTGILDIDSQEDYELLTVIAEYLYSHNNEYQCVQRRVRVMTGS